MNYIRTLLLLFLLVPCAPDLALAQTPFETVRVSFGPALPVYTRNMSSWTPPYGGGLTLDTPFFVGELELGLQVVRWTSDSEATPDFDSALIFAGWALSSSSQNAVKASAGVRVGNYFMAFDSQQVAGERNESEFAFSPFIRLRRTLFRRLEGHIEAQATRVFTQPNLDLIQITAGLAVTFDAPGWLREVLE